MLSVERSERMIAFIGTISDSLASLVCSDAGRVGDMASDEQLFIELFIGADHYHEDTAHSECRDAAVRPEHA